MNISQWKRGAAILLSFCMALGLVACGSGETTESGSQRPSQDIQTSPVPELSAPAETPAGTERPNDSHILIAYFSLWDNAPWGEYTDTNTSASVVIDEQGAIGTTGYVARMIQDTVGGDLHVIQTAEPYSADFDSVVSENHQEDSRTISSTVEDMEQYNTIFIGYPVWATSLPQAVRTFLTEYDFSGKTLIPFCTH